MSGACDANHNYVLFENGSPNPTRQWYRSENSGRMLCAPFRQEKLKYHVLKHPPSTVAPPPLTVSTTNRLKTVTVGGKTFSVDTNIYDDVAAALVVTPATDITQLRAIISSVRAKRNLPSPINVQLQNVGLGNYTKRYTYKSADVASQVKTKTEPSPNRIFNTPIKSSEYAKNVQVTNLEGDVVPLTETEPWKELLDAEKDYAFLFPGKSFVTDDSQFMLVAENNGCAYTGVVKSVFPQGLASIFGVMLLTRNALRSFYREGKTVFEPFACKLTPAQKGLASKVGVIVQVHSDNVPSAFLFVPAQSDLERLQQKEWGVGLGFTII